METIIWKPYDATTYGNQHSCPFSFRVSIPERPHKRSSVQVGKCNKSDNAQFQYLDVSEALDRYATVQPSSLNAFVQVLNQCRKLKSFAIAEKVYMLMCHNGLQYHATVGNYLVPLLVESGHKAKALQSFNALYDRREHSWTALIEEYVRCGQIHEALKLYEQMKEDNVNPSSYTLVSLLKASAGMKALKVGHELHDWAVRLGLSDKDDYIKSALVDMYCKCDSLKEGDDQFSKQKSKDLVSWTAMITGYAEHGCTNEALNCYYKMKMEGVSPNTVSFVCSLKACKAPGDVSFGQEIHIDIVKEGYEDDPFVSSSLVDMYAKCGALVEAQRVSDKMPYRDVVSWTSLLAGYVDYGHTEEALYCSEQMQADGVSHNAVSFMYILKACSSMEDAEIARLVHSSAVKTGFESKLLVANTLIDTYAKFVLLTDAWLIFNQLDVRDIFSWNMLISGYSESGLGEEAVKCFWRLLPEGLSRDPVTCIYTLRACANTQAIDAAREVHLQICKEGFDNNLCVGTALVDMYAKCGFLDEAFEVFIQLGVRDVVSWTALLTGYSEQEMHDEALDCFAQMQLEKIVLDAVTYASILGSCGRSGLQSKGEELHAEIIKVGLEDNAVIGNSMIDMYAKLGLLTEADAVFKRLVSPDVISWNGLMTGYAEEGLSKDVWSCYQAMQSDGLTLDSVTSILVLKACNELGDLDKGQHMHAEITIDGLEREPLLCSSLVNMYSKFGFLADALDVFNEHSDPDIASWTALIGGLAENGFPKEAIGCFQQMQTQSLVPNPMTFVCSLKACMTPDFFQDGQRIHYEIVKNNFNDEIFVASSLIDMYAGLGFLVDARSVLEELSHQDVVSWTALMGGYIKNGFLTEALACLEHMKLAGICPSPITYTFCLKVCGEMKLTSKGQSIHSELILQGLESDPSVGRILVHMYVKNGLFNEGKKVFDDLLDKYMVSWSTLILGCTAQGCYSEALCFVEEMRAHGVSLNVQAWVSIVKAFGGSEAIQSCQALHNLLVEGGLEAADPISSTLVQMYIKCGLLSDAWNLFKRLPDPKSIAWSALVAEYLKEHGLESMFYEAPETLSISC